MFFIQNEIQYNVSPLPRLFPLPPPPPPYTHTHYVLGFKVIVYFFYLIDKREFRRAILSHDSFCFIVGSD